MQPFLKKRDEKTNPGLIVKTREPDKAPEGEDDSHAGIHACAQDLIDAVHAKDVKGAADAMKAAFEIMDSMPHEEGPHIKEEDEDAAD